MMISVVITVKNEERLIKHLLDSLVIQEGPLEILIVDAHSTDKTRKIVRNYMKKYDFIKLILYPATRGESRNKGIDIVKGKAVAFIDGDCIANPFWLKKMREGLRKGDVVAGKTINMGYESFVQLGRVELFYKGMDVTYPSCNLVYKTGLLRAINGFDPKFVTAEDIDLNVRAIDRGAKVVYEEDAVVYHQARSTLMGFVKQAFWNGFGRKQLTRKHGNLWSNYKPGLMMARDMSFWYMLRMVIALMGYVSAKFLADERYK